MSSHEHDSSDEPITTAQAVWELKVAQTYLLVSPMEWRSADGEYVYSASPLEVPGEEPVDLATLPDMPLWRLIEVLDTWKIYRVSKPDANGDIAMDRFVLRAGVPLLHVAHRLPGELIESGEIEAMVDALTRSAELQSELGFSRAGPEDYGLLSNAIADLKVVADAAISEQMQRRQELTDEELRWERMQKFKLLIPPEMDVKGPARWWGISEGNRLYAVHCATPDEAIVMIEESRDGEPIFPFFFIDQFSEEVQTELAEKLGDQTVVRLIPFSTEEWPSDPGNMTESQRAAFDKLRRDS